MKRYGYTFLIVVLSMLVIIVGCSNENDVIKENTTQVNRSQINVEEMVFIPAGEVIVGTAQKTTETFGHEADPQQVFVEAFYIDKYEVTNAQYAKFLEATGHRKPTFGEYKELNAPDQPVVGVSWEDAQAYAQWVGKRLPTDIEWEKAARGVEGYLYPWGNDYDPSRGNFDDGGRMDGHIDGYGMAPAPVGSFAGDVSPYGVYDMAGNVWEWVASVLVDPKEVRYTIRGGAWINAEGDTRTTVYYIFPEECSDHTSSVGFRCAKTP